MDVSPTIVLVEVTAIPTPTAEDAKVPVPTKVTSSGATTPTNVPVSIASVFPSKTLF